MLNLVVLGACVLGLAFSSAASANAKQCSDDLAKASLKLSLVKDEVKSAEKKEAVCKKNSKLCAGLKESPAALVKKAIAKLKDADAAYNELKRKCSASAPPAKKPGQGAPADLPGSPGAPVERIVGPL